MMGGGVEESQSMWALVHSWLTPSFFFLFLNLTIGSIAVLSAFATQKNKHQQPSHFTEGQRVAPLPRAPSLLSRVKSFDFSAYYTAPSPEPAPVDPHPTPSSGPETSDTPEQPRQLNPTSSFVERVRSFDFSLYHYKPSPTETALVNLTPSPPETARFEPAASSGSPRMKRLPVNRWPEDPEPEYDPVSEEADYQPEISDTGHGVIESEAPPQPERVPQKLKRWASFTWSFGRRDAEEEEAIDRRRPETMRENRSTAAAAFNEEDEGVDAKADDFINQFKQQLKLQRLNSMKLYREMINRGAS